MKRTLFILAQVFLFVLVSANIARAQNHVQTITVTNGTTTITADGNYNQVLVRENAASPSAAFSITLSGTSTALNYPAGTQFLFTGNFVNGQAIGTIQATSAGPFTFIAVEASGPPSMSVKNTILSGGSSGNATSIQGLAVSSTAPTGGVNCFETNSGDTQALWGSCSGAAGVTSFSSGNLSPLFTASVATPTSTPALTFTLSNAAGNTVFGNCTGSSAAPSYCSITGAMLPNPGASTLGGVESYASVSHQWINAISTLGVPSSTQPAFTDISGILGIGAGGTNATSAANALINLFPAASEVGDIVYCSAYSSGCTAWTILAGNTSGTKVLQETSSGVPSWVAGGGGSGTVNNCSVSTGAISYYSSSGTAVSCDANIQDLGSGELSLGIAGTQAGSLRFTNATSGSITLNPATGVLGSPAITIPATSGTMLVSGSLTANGMVYAPSSTTVGSTAAATNGQILIGSTGAAPVLAALAAGAGTLGGISIVNGAGTITLGKPNDEWSVSQVSSTPSGTKFLPLQGYSAAAIGAVSAANQVMGRAKTFTGMVVYQSANTAGTSIVYVLQSCTPAGGPPTVCTPASSNITCTIAAGANTCSDTAHTLSVALGDLVVIQYTQNGSGAATTIDASTLFF